MPLYQEYDLETPAIVNLEVVLSPRSQFIGHTLKETHFREKYGMTVLAVWNGERVIRTSLADLKLAFGDALLLQGPRDRLPMLRLSSDMIVLSQEEEPHKTVVKKRTLALSIFGLTLAIAALGPFSVGEVMLAGALIMISLGPGVKPSAALFVPGSHFVYVGGSDGTLHEIDVSATPGQKALPLGNGLSTVGAPSLDRGYAPALLHVGTVAGAFYAVEMPFPPLGAAMCVASCACQFAGTPCTSFGASPCTATCACAGPLCAVGDCSDGGGS